VYTGLRRARGCWDILMRNSGRALVAASAVIVAAHVAPATRRWPGSLFFPRIVRTRADSAVALTFDDGPDRGLDAFLDLLEEARARATFFVAGEQVERDPSKLREIISRGHEVGVHCYRHRPHLLLTPAGVVEDMRRARNVIEEAAERPTRLFRPPYGRFSLASWVEASRQGWERVLWTRNGRDYAAWATPQSIVDNIGWPIAGDIVLLHDSDRYGTPGSWHITLKALPTILERIDILGLRTCPVGELLMI
jgi:peptidoglycan/xylan/chitin deacetylase (PgdA/CDA1 family)